MITYWLLLLQPIADWILRKLFIWFPSQYVGTADYCLLITDLFIILLLNLLINKLILVLLGEQHPIWTDTAFLRLHCFYFIERMSLFWTEASSSPPPLDRI